MQEELGWSAEQVVEWVQRNPNNFALDLTGPLMTHLLAVSGHSVCVRAYVWGGPS